MRWAFIDYENIGNLGKIDLSGYERVIVFLGAKQPRLDFANTRYDKPINMLVVHLKETQANNLDFHLAYYMGKLDAAAEKDVVFEVVSNDAGFAPLITHIQRGGRTCKQLTAVGLSADSKRLIQSLKSKPVEKRPKKVAGLRNYVASYLGLQGDDIAIQNHLNQLVRNNVVTISEAEVEYKC